MDILNLALGIVYSMGILKYLARRSYFELYQVFMHNFYPELI